MKKEELCPHCGYYCTGKTAFCIKDSEGKINTFEWMKSWLEAYQKENKDIDVEKIMDWILSQPMQSS